MKRVCLIALAAVGCLGGPFGSPSYADARSGQSHAQEPLTIRHASLRQQGQLRLRLSTDRGWGPAVLRGPSRPYICVQLFHGAMAVPRRQICLASGPAHVNFGLRLVSEALRSNGAVLARKRFGATIERRDRRSLTARFLATDAGVQPGRWRWRIVSGSSRRICPPRGSAPGCSSEHPASGTLSLRVRSVHLVGCVPEGTSYREHGSKGKREVALSFDDGPSPFTPAILDVLNHDAVPATFFVIGNQIAGNETLLVRELQQHDDIGNHTWDHANLSGGGAVAHEELVRTNAAITGATGFTPCLFRAPYGAVSNSLFGIARTLGLATVGWDVDPRDWSRPGATAIYGSVLSTVRNGSIVLMHDGGGPRDETVAALDVIIRALKARGYRLVTVSELFGYRPVYRP